MPSSEASRRSDGVEAGRDPGAAGTGGATDRLLRATQAVAPSAADLLRAIVDGRGLSLPEDLVSGIGSGGSTLWKVNAAQTLVVSNTSREATIDDAFECGRIAATAALTAVHATAARRCSRG